MDGCGLNNRGMSKGQAGTSAKAQKAFENVLVLGIGGSPRQSGNTEYLVKYVLERVAEKGFRTEYISLSGKVIHPCRACYGCRETGRCTQKGDDFEPVYSRMREADALIVGSPVHYGSASPIIMSLLDRAAFSSRKEGRIFSRKVGAPIAVARRAGHNFVLAQLLYWFLINDMIVPGSTYWTVALAGAGGARDAANDREALATLDHLAENIAWLLEKTR